MNEDKDIQSYDNKLAEHCERLRKKVINSHPSDNFKKWFKYYFGRYDKTDFSNNLINMRNIVKPIVETKTRYLLDSNITTAVIPKIISQIDIEKMRIVDKIASFQDDTLKHVFKINKFERIKENFAKHGNITGIGIIETVWDKKMSQGLGDVKIININPLDFFWDPDAKTIEQMNYCFIKLKMSKYTLKKDYAVNPDGSVDIEMIEKLNKISNSKSEDKGSKKDPKAIVSYQTNETGNLAYVYPSDGMATGSDEIEVWKCYLKDDTTFIPEGKSDPKLKDKEELRFKYPFGRMILYTGKEGQYVVLDDRPIDYPFGFPIDIYNDMETDDIQGQGEVEDLIEIQDRINRSYIRIRDLVQKYVSFIAYDPKTTGLRDQSFINAVSALPVEGLSQYPSSVQMITNNTLSEIQSVLEMIKVYEQESYKIARINESMVSGERAQGVNSGVMVEALNEPAMISIRSMQKNFSSAIISISEKILILISIYYNVPRFLRISEGKQFIKIPTRPDSEKMNQIQSQSESEGIDKYEVKDELGQYAMPSMEVYEKKEDGDIELIEEIRGDMSLGEYEVEIVAGSEMPRSKTQFAQITQQLAAQGVFGDPNSIEVKELLLKSLDFPNRHAIINEIKKQQEKAQGAPPPLPPIEKMGLSYKDLSPELRSMLLKSLFGQDIPPEQTLTADEKLKAQDEIAKATDNQQKEQMIQETENIKQQFNTIGL